MNNDELKKASEFEEEIEKSSSLDELNSIRIKYMGKKGMISLLNKVLGLSLIHISEPTRR